MIREPVAFGLAVLAGLVVVSPAATARAQGPEVSETAPEDSSENGGLSFHCFTSTRNL